MLDARMFNTENLWWQIAGLLFPADLCGLVRNFLEKKGTTRIFEIKMSKWHFEIQGLLQKQQFSVWIPLST